MKVKISYAYSSFFLGIPRIRGKNLSVYGEYGKFRAIYSTQNHPRIRGKIICIHGEDVKIHKTKDIGKQ